MKITQKHPKLREQFRQDLEHLFHKALESKNYQAALKAKELLAKEAGILTKNATSNPQDSTFPQEISLGEISDDLIEALIEALKKQLNNLSST